MPTRARYKNRIELLQGTLNLLILQTLQWGPQPWLRNRAGNPHQLEGGAASGGLGSLYPALHRLERQKLIGASWKVSDNRQRTRVDRLTRKGREQLLSERSRWSRFAVEDAVAGTQ